MPRLDRYQRPEVYEALAAGYVLGVLGGRARKRFEGLIAERDYIGQAVADWEQRLAPLNESVPEQAPPVRLWRRIERELSVPEPVRRKRGSFWNSVTTWRISTATALVLLVAITATQLLVRTEPVMPEYVAVLEGDQGSPMIVATARRTPMGIKLMKVNDMQVEPNMELEVWCMMPGSRQASSMGTLGPGKETLLPLTQTDWDMVEQAAVLAVSLEPKGHERGDAPSGPLLWKGSFVPTS